MVENGLLALAAAFAALAYVLATIFVVSGVDDMSYDLYFWGWYLRRRWVVRAFPRLTVERLEAREQQKIAVFIPAFQEANVLGSMLARLCGSVRYRNYDVFVGTYPNDHGTQQIVDQLTRRNPRIHKVVTDVPGPTTKAHNLNSIYRAVLDHEHRSRQRYEIIVTHDAEDVVHPLSFLTYNYLIPRVDMVQLPVFPVRVPLREVSHWMYADEFSEHHTKILLTREVTGGFVPSAGTGVAYTRRAFEVLAGKEGFFPTHTVTEDYQTGLQMRLAGFRTAFVMQRLALPAGVERGGGIPTTWVATRALFPRRFETAVRQRARWQLGIVFQSWALLGWRGNLTVKYNLLHDRKALVTVPAALLGYLVLAYVGIHEGILRPFVFTSLPPFVEVGSPLWTLIVLATAGMLWRVSQRAIAVGWVYGLWPAITSPLRIPWANIVDGVALVRAARTYLIWRRGHQVAWDKTAHEFPQPVNGPPTAAPPTAAGITEPAGEEAPVDEARLIAAVEASLRAEPEAERVAAIRRIPRHLGARFLAPLRDLLRDPSWAVRAEACRALSAFQLSETAPALGQAATDPDWVVRANAVKALTKLGDTGETVLLTLIQGTDRYARDAALAALEQHSYIARNLSRLRSSNLSDVSRARTFFALLEAYGPSRVARKILAQTGTPLAAEHAEREVGRKSLPK